MKTRYTRREFLLAGLGGTVVLGSGFAGAALPEEKSAPRALRPKLHEILRAAADEIIPAGDGMPATGETGAPDYLDRLLRQTPSLKREFEAGLAGLDRLARKRFRKNFVQLSRPQRVQTLAELEKTAAPDFFRTLRDCIYEAYYLQPQVWKQIGYDFYPFQKPGPFPKPFDEDALAGVRKMPKLYREVT